MPSCRFCHEPAGLLHWQHAKCAEEHEKGRQSTVAAIIATLRDGGDLAGLAAQLSSVEKTSFISASEHRDLLFIGFDAAVDAILKQNVVDEDQEHRLVNFGGHFGLDRAEMQKRPSYSNVVKSGALRELMAGIVPHRVTFDGTPNINLLKSEEIVWAFPGTSLLEDKIRRMTVGRTSGVSMRVMKGVYYHTGSFAGRQIERTERVHSDTGTLWATTKNLYFTGPSKSLRLPYPKIVSFQPFSDGIGVMKDAASAKAQVFVTGDGWFTYNLVTNLAHLAM